MTSGPTPGPQCTAVVSLPSQPYPATPQQEAAWVFIRRYVQSRPKLSPVPIEPPATRNSLASLLSSPGAVLARSSPTPPPLLACSRCAVPLTSADAPLLESLFIRVTTVLLSHPLAQGYFQAFSYHLTTQPRAPAPAVAATGIMSGSSSPLPPRTGNDALKAISPDPVSHCTPNNDHDADTTHNGLNQVGLGDSSSYVPHTASHLPLSPPSSRPVASSRSSTTTTPTRYPAGQLQFRSTTIAPSPPASRSPTASSLSPLALRTHDILPESPSDTLSPFSQSPPSASALSSALGSGLAISGPSPLRIHTDLQSLASPSAASTLSVITPLTPRNRPDPLNLAYPPVSPGAATTPTSSYTRPSALALHHKSSASSLRPISRTPSLKTAGYHGFGTVSAASSTVSSPIIAAMGDVTPLPSPLLSSDSPGPWKKLRFPTEPPAFGSTPSNGESALVSSNGESLSSALANHQKRKAYAELAGLGGGQRTEGGLTSHTRDRSMSEYVPDPMHLPKRMITVSATHSKQPGAPDHSDSSLDTQMRREPHLSGTRGLTPVQKPPTPPPSESSLLLSDGTTASEPNGQQRPEYFEAVSRDGNKRRRWRSIKMLGQGTFSRVMLATNQMTVPDEAAEDNEQSASSVVGRRVRYDRRTLVAVKVCEHGPKGGASEDRIEMSLKRELELMQCIQHPSLVRLKAWSIEPTRALLVLSYCPGGDLFDVASAHRDLLSPPLLARMFAEMVGAVRYLHHEHIVHRDIKLENVLVNLTPKELADKLIDWATYPYSVTTLTDLGLSRRVADDEKLETRCGSDDYAAPEVIMGQPYDGRAIDAWSLGVLLYALLEGRLPFDPTPGMSDAHRMRSRTSHRIARVEWRWVEYAGDDGNHEGNLAKFKAKGLDGAMELTEGLLKRARTRWTMDKVANFPWVQGAMRIEGGLRFREEEEGKEIS